MTTAETSPERNPLSSVEPPVTATPQTTRVNSEPLSEEPHKPHRKGSKVGATWIFAFLGLILLIFLLLFVLQNQNTVTMNLFTWTTSYPLGVGMLLAAIVGALIMALIGSIRIIQLRRQVKQLESKNATQK